MTKPFSGCISIDMDTQCAQGKKSFLLNHSLVLCVACSSTLVSALTREEKKNDQIISAAN